MFFLYLAITLIVVATGYFRLRQSLARHRRAAINAPDVTRRRTCHWHPTGHATEQGHEFHCQSCGTRTWSQSPSGPIECQSPPAAQSR